MLTYEKYGIMKFDQEQLLIEEGEKRTMTTTEKCFHLKCAFLIKVKFSN